jgi:hypothetical protein
MRMTPEAARAGWRRRLAVALFRGLILASLALHSVGLCRAGDAAVPGTWQDTLLRFCRELNGPTVPATDTPGVRATLAALGEASFTLTCWVRTRQDGVIFAKCLPDGAWRPQDKALFIRDGRLCFDVGWVACITAQGQVSDGNWHHLALAYDRGAGRQRLFVDGAEAGSGALTMGPESAGAVFTLGRGAVNFPAATTFAGEIDEIRVYAQALAADAVQADRERPGAALPPAALLVLTLDGPAAPGMGAFVVHGEARFGAGRTGGGLLLDGQSFLQSSAPSGTTAWASARGAFVNLGAGARDLAAAARGARLRADLATDVGKLLFVRRSTYSANHYYTEYINSAWQPGGGLAVLDLRTGTVTDLLPDLASGVVERFDLSFDAQHIVFAWKAGPQVGYRLYEVDSDGRNLRQLTFPPPEEDELIRQYRVDPNYHHGTDDMQPCYLPDGGIAFISSRCQYGILCDPPDNFTTTTLYRIDADGANLRKLSNSSVSEACPVALSDGRILYTRWEYVDKGAVSVKCLWAMRPDGSASTEIYGNDIALPPTLLYGRPIPDHANLFVALGTPHCPQNGVGTVIRLDTRRDLRTREPMTYMTPDVDIQAEPGFAFRDTTRDWENDGAGRGPLYKDPYPLGPGLFLVAHKARGPEWNDPKGYGLALLEETGATYPLYRDPTFSCWLPYPVRARPRPPVLPSTANPELASEGKAVCVVSDVYAGLEGVERGEIRFIRILEQVPRPWAARRRWGGDEYDQQHVVISKDTHLGLKVQHGVVPVEADGSACFVVPAEANIILQVLDGNYLAVQTERTFVDYAPGEVRSCVGCHERPADVSAPGGPASRQALVRAPSLPGPQPGETSGARPLDYLTDVQPVWDRACLDCHGRERRDGDLDLRGTPTERFCVSYEQLVPERRRGTHDRGLLGPVIGENHPKTGNVHYLPARSLGSHASVLVAMLSAGNVRLADPAQAARAAKLAVAHRDVQLTPEELLRVTNWVDTNCQFYGSYWGKRNLSYKDDPTFRPTPTFEQAVSRTPPPGF